MKLTGTIASMALTIGALMLQLSEAAAGRGHVRRVLEDASDDATNGGAGEGNSNSYYSSSGWNGRGQSWSSSSQIQSYNDDGITEFTVDNSSNKLNIFGSFGGGEIFMLLGLLIIVGISVFSYLALQNDFNLSDTLTPPYSTTKSQRDSCITAAALTIPRSLTSR